MGFSSQSGQVILRKQSAQGSYASDIDTAGLAVKLRSGALGSNRDLLVPDPEIGGGRDVTGAYMGAIAWSGSYDFYTRPDLIATLIQAALGVSTVATTTGVTTVSNTPSDAAQLPFYSIEETLGTSLECFNYTDAVLNTLHLESDANGFLSGTAGWIAAKQTAGNTKTASPVWDNGPLFIGTNIAITYNGVTVPAKSFSLDINNNFEDDDFRLGSFYLGDLTPKRREITAGFHIRESSSALWRQAVYGVNSLTAPGGLPSPQQLIITATTYEKIPSSTPSTAWSVGFTIPKFTLTPYSFDASGDDIIESDLTGQAFRPVVGTPIMSSTVVTGTTAVS